MYAVPREQLVRPGQRRSLMRRALVGIVPDELLNRKRKAYVTRSPMTAITADWNEYAAMAEHMVGSSLAIIEKTKFSEALQKARRGQELPLVTVMRTVGLELWLRSVKRHEVIEALHDRRSQARESLEPKMISAGPN